MQYEAINSFSGLISMIEGEVRDIPNEKLAKELIKAGFIKEYKPGNIKELTKSLDEANSTIEELTKSLDEANSTIEELNSQISSLTSNDVNSDKTSNKN